MKGGRGIKHTRAYFAAFSRDVGAGSEARKRGGARGVVATENHGVVYKRRGADQAASEGTIS